jgi:hypothetical protein
VKEFILAALLAVPFLAAPFVPQAAPQESPAAKADAVDPFYRNLYDSGKDAFERGAVQEAVGDFEIASFGYLDDPPRMLECCMYLAVGHFDLRDFDKSKAALEEIRRLDLETHMATAGPSETLLKRFREVQGRFQQAPKPPGK